jgi:outer membrane protein assembly factor BamE
MLHNAFLKSLATAMLLVVLSSASGCVFRANISQGNIVEQDDVDQLEVGMTSSQVRFLLGTPMIDDPFNADRWDYIYYLNVGREDARAKRWLTVVFDEDGRVAEIRPDQELSKDL